MFIDSYEKNFSSMDDIIDDEKAANKRWCNSFIGDIKVALSDDVMVAPSPQYAELYPAIKFYSSDVSVDAAADTKKHTGLAVCVNGSWYPLRDTALQSLLDRAAINGPSLSRLDKTDLVGILNKCLSLYNKQESIINVSEQKVSYLASDNYCVLPIAEIFEAVKEMCEKRFPGYRFSEGYKSHSFTTARVQFPHQRELIENYRKLLEEDGHDALAANLIPSLKIMTSDVGKCAARAVVYLDGGKCPILVGSCLEVDHRASHTVADFRDKLDLIYVKFEDQLRLLENLHRITITNPVETMKRVCHTLHLPKQASLEVAQLYNDIYGTGTTNAGNVYLFMQQIAMYIEKSESKLRFYENLERALKLPWSKLDLPGTYNW